MSASFPIANSTVAPAVSADKTPASSPSQAGNQPATTTEALQKATQNPVPDLISVPPQHNVNFRVGPYNGTENVLNIQSFIPTHLTENWNLISRIIAPIVWQPIQARTPITPHSSPLALGATQFAKQLAVDAVTIQKAVSASRY